MPSTTWYSKTSVNAAVSLSSESKVPAGKSAKASLVGANTVKLPGEDSVSTRPAACTAVTSVLRSGVATASSTMFDEPVKARAGSVVARPTKGSAAATPAVLPRN